MAWNIEAGKKYRNANRDAINERARSRRDTPEYREKVRERNRLYSQKRRKEDPQFRLTINLRNRLNRAIALDCKKGSAVKLLGCSIADFKTYISARFAPGMTWSNYGKWHIDHILPLSSFDLNTPIELEKACHYSNLQPLWAKDNLKKSDRVPNDIRDVGV